MDALGGTPALSSREATPEESETCKAVAAAVLPALGSTLDGKYRLDRILGEGGMGIVYEAFHLRLQHRVAIKMLLPAVLQAPEFVARFEREARAAATLESPSVAKILDVDTSPEGLPYMVIEYLDGHDLAAELQKRGRLPIAEAVALVMEACVPIGQAHARGIVHRDLKPANLFLATNGGQPCLKLLDFGVSKVLADIDVKVTTSLQGLGTPHYMSPEQIRDAGNVDPRSDIWSLGIILYELMTGATPFSGSASSVIAAIAADPLPLPRTLRPDIPEALQDVIMRALDKDRGSRFPDVQSLAVALAPFASEEELVLASSIPPPPAVPVHVDFSLGPKTSVGWTGPIAGLPSRRWRWLWMLIPAAAALALVGWWRAGPAPHAELAAAQTSTAVATAPLPVVEVPVPPPVAASAPSAIPSATHVPVRAHVPVAPLPPPTTNPLTL